MKLRWLPVVFLIASLASGDVIFDVRTALQQNNFAAAQSMLQSYRSQHGVDPPYLEALSWMARGELLSNQLDSADALAKQTEAECRSMLQHRPLDAEPHLPLALGAALEVEAQVLAARGKNQQALALLRRGLATYGTTSIRARLQKNLNLLTLSGLPAPPLSISEYLGTRPSSLAQMKGSPVLLFFWAHWCSDCKHEGPIISQLTSEFAAQGLKVEAPTQRYGYAAYGESATPKDEVEYIGRVWQHYYPGLQDVPVPISKTNFDRYGASTTPTLVLIDRGGRVALYHPGVMSYDELRTAIQRLL